MLPKRGVRWLTRSAVRMEGVLENFWERGEGMAAVPYGGYQWFERWHHRAARKIRAKLHTVDVVVEIRDARAPFSTYNSELEKLTSGKPRIVVFNKADLADRSCNKKLLEFYEQLGVPSLLTNFGGLAAGDARKLAKLIEKNRPPTFLNTAPVNCLVVGMPNVGKSSLINALRKAFVDELTNTYGFRWKTSKRLMKKQERVGGSAGLTRKVGSVAVPVAGCDITLIDTPGLLIPKVTNIRQSDKIATLGLANFVHQQGTDHFERVGRLVWDLCMEHGMEAAVMSHFRMAYPPPTNFMDFKKRAILTLDMLGKAAKKDLRWYTPKTYGQGMFYIFRRPIMKLVTAFQKGDFGRVTLDEIPTIDSHNVVAAPEYIKKLYEEEKEVREERLKLENIKREQQWKTGDGEKVEDEDEDVDPRRVWNIKSKTVDVTASEHVSAAPGKSQFLYKLDKVVDSLKERNEPISRRSGTLQGDLNEFDTDRLSDIRSAQRSGSERRNAAFNLLYDTQRRGRSQPWNMDPDKFPKVSNLIRIRNFSKPNPLNDYSNINILTGEMKSRSHDRARSEEAGKRVTLGNIA